MPLPAGCSSWNYEDFPGWDGEVVARTEEALIALRRGQVDTRAACVDTRDFHHRLFHSLTRPNEWYFAGHYRGEPFRCLRPYEVEVKSDPRVGFPAGEVAHNMQRLRGDLEEAIAALDSAQGLPEAQLSPAEKLIYVVIVACSALEDFFRIHPYADGNGHSGRWLVWVLLARYGFSPQRWPIHPGPRGYGDLLSRYRDGDRRPLERYLLNAILGN